MVVLYHLLCTSSEDDQVSSEVDKGMYTDWVVSR